MNKEIIFVIVIMLWGFLGISAIPRKDRPDYEMILFFLFTPFIPLVALLCGLL